MIDRRVRAGRRRTAMLIFAAAVAFVLSLSGSALKSTIQVYFATIAGDLNVDINTFAWATTTFAVVIAIASPVVGVIADRYGGAGVLIGGMVLSALTFLLCAAKPGVLLFAPAYGVLGAFAFTALSYVPLGKLANELFAKRGEGLAYAVMTNGPAVGFVVLVPLWVWLGTRFDWRPVFVAIGVVMLVVLTPLAIYLRRLTADDETTDEATQETTAAAAETAVPEPDRGLGEKLSLVLGNGRFLLIALAFGGCGVTMAFVDVHLVTDLDMSGMRPAMVSTTVSVLGVFEILGSLVAGRICDRGWIKWTLVGGYALRGTAMLFLVATPTPGTSLVFSVVFGTSYMATVIATTLWVSRLVPAHVRGTAVGLVWTVHSIGAAASSQVGAFAAQRYHSYLPVALAEAVVVFGSMAIAAALPNPERTPVSPPASRPVADQTS